MRSNSPKITIFRDALTPSQDAIEAKSRLRACQTGEDIGQHLEPASERLVIGVLSSSDIQHPTVHSLVRTQGGLRNPMIVQTFGWRHDILSIPKR